MLDYIYRIAAPPSDISELGLRIDEWGNQSCSCQGVRDRRDILSDAIDEAAIATKMPRILAVACGHLREVQRSKAVRDRSIGEFYALDQDPESLELVATENAGLGIQPVHGSVRTLLSRKTDFRDLDLIYAAGLYDYLPDPIAARLTSRLFSMMRPGGRLLIANFCPELPDIPFMEACMDWDLIYRNEEQMEGFLSQISSEYRAEVFRDRLGYIAYLDIRKDALRY